MNSSTIQWNFLQLQIWKLGKIPTKARWLIPIYNTQAQNSNLCLSEMTTLWQVLDNAVEAAGAKVLHHPVPHPGLWAPDCSLSHQWGEREEGCLCSGRKQWLNTVYCDYCVLFHVMSRNVVTDLAASLSQLPLTFPQLTQCTSREEE